MMMHGLANVRQSTAFKRMTNGKCFCKICDFIMALTEASIIWAVVLISDVLKALTIPFNIRNCTPNNTATHPRRYKSSVDLLSQYESLYICLGSSTNESESVMVVNVYVFVQM
jgi:hypothetical protein